MSPHLNAQKQTVLVRVLLTVYVTAYRVPVTGRHMSASTDPYQTRPAAPGPGPKQHMCSVVSADDWDHHRVMLVTATGQNTPFMTHLSPSNRRFQRGYWEITATKIS